MNLKIKQLNPEQPAGVSLPAYPGDAGLDLIALNDVIIPPNSYINIPHGFAIEIPEGYFGYVMPRSSTIRHNQGNILVMASPIDSGYRGEIFTMVRNNGNEPILITAGQRVSQMVILPFASISSLEKVKELSKSQRSTNGFGSSGK
jgi:dUTP pyrophosphatase